MSLRSPASCCLGLLRCTSIGKREVHTATSWSGCSAHKLRRPNKRRRYSRVSNLGKTCHCTATKNNRTTHGMQIRPLRPSSLSSYDFLPSTAGSGRHSPFSSLARNAFLPFSRQAWFRLHDRRQALFRDCNEFTFRSQSGVGFLRAF